MPLGKKVFEAVAAAINAERTSAYMNFSRLEGLAADATAFNMAHAIANTFADLDNKFNHRRFMKACGYPEDRV
jgi:predicted PhzF superfamily epimerase YddE/YHI9